MSKEFKQSLQLTREEIFKRFLDHCKNNKPIRAKKLIDYFKITKDEIHEICVDILYHLSLYAHSNIVDLLLNHGITTEQCKNMLVLASNSNDPKIVRVLLAHDIDPKYCTEALNGAASKNDIVIIKLLLAYGIKPEQCTEALKISKEYREYRDKEIIALLETHIIKGKLNAINEEQEIIKQLFTLAEHLEKHSMIIVVNKPKK